MFLRRLRPVPATLRPNVYSSRPFASSTVDHGKDQHQEHHEEVNEPTGYLFNRVPGVKEESNPARNIFIVGYLGGLFAFGLLYYYKPDTRKQVHAETWAKQQELWADVVLGFCESKRIYTIDYETVDAPFNNELISRRANAELIKSILEYMVSQNQGEWLPGRPSTCLIYWRKPSEWADLIYGHIKDSNQLNSIVTVYELFEGDETAGCPFHGLPEVFWARVLRPLQKANRAAVFGAESDSAITAETGIKFI